MQSDNHVPAVVEVRFSSILFTSLPPGHREQWERKFEEPYPTDEFLRAFSQNLNTFAATEGGQFLDFAEKQLNILDIEPVHTFFACPWISGSISSPGIINPTRSAKDMQTALLHELMHRILTRNSRYDINIPSNSSLLHHWHRIWGMQLPFATIVHLPVFAILDQYVAQHPELLSQLDADKARHKHYPDYARAWELLEENGSEKIARDAKECFESMLPNN